MSKDSLETDTFALWTFFYSQSQDQPPQEPGYRLWETDTFSNLQTNSEDTILGTDSESEDEAEEEDVLSKEKPKHSWFLVPEVISRQYGKNMFKR